MTALETLLNGKTVAVVGNAPTATQFDFAARIDAADVVIRFNRFHLEGYPQVGSRTSVIAFPLGWSPALPDIALVEKLQPLLLAVCPQIDDSTKNNARRYGEAALEFFPIDYFEKLSLELGCRPTTGFAVICGLIDLWTPAQVLLTGFSFARLTDDHYFPSRTFNYLVHDPVKELHLYARKHPPGIFEIDPHIQSQLYGRKIRPRRERSRVPDPDHFSSASSVYQQVVPSVRAQPVLLVGAGSEIGAGMLLEAATRLTIVEPDIELRALLRRQCPELPLIDASFSDLDPGARFHSAVVDEVIEYLPAIEVHGFLRKLRAHAGHLFLSTPDREANMHGTRTAAEWGLALAAAGWAVTEVKEIGVKVLITAR